MFGIRVRKSTGSRDAVVIEPTTLSEREWYEMDRYGKLIELVHKVFN